MPQRLLLLVAILATGLITASTGLAAAPKLVGVVGPGFTITLKSGGKVVKTLKAGTYTIAVQDKASIHDFHLQGPGVNKTTTVPFVGAQTWTVKLQKGTYTYQCDPHASAGMKGSFKVT
jgi:plastocyanin